MDREKGYSSIYPNTSISIYSLKSFESRAIARHLLLRDIPLHCLARDAFEYIVNALLNAKPQGDC